MEQRLLKLCYVTVFFQFINGQITQNQPDIIDLYHGLTSKLSQIQNVGDLTKNFVNPERAVLDKFIEIDELIEEIEENQNNVDDIIEKVCNDYEFVLNPWRKVERSKLHIQLDYQCFRNFIRNSAYVDEVVTNDFCERQKSKENLEVIHNAIVSENTTDTLLYKLFITLWYQVSFRKFTFEPSDQKFKLFQDGKHLCSLGHSPHQIIYNLYNVIALTEIKGYAMIQFAYMIMRLHGEGNFTTGN